VSFDSGYTKFDFMIRLLFLIAAVVFALYVAYRFISLFTGGKNRNICPDCEGKGYWYGLREREFCKRCDGTGELKD
jgi:hypothetical protein